MALNLTDNWQMALNLTDNWQMAKILTDNWHLHFAIQTLNKIYRVLLTERKYQQAPK